MSRENGYVNQIRTSKIYHIYGDVRGRDGDQRGKFRA